ncbi:MAG: polysaccharide deacetylase family protein [Oscillospiraceae bacterium]|nr:polysaccharide deacetylase family protein [Oscillospiraceae bacterium]
MDIIKKFMCLGTIFLAIALLLATAIIFTGCGAAQADDGVHDITWSFLTYAEPDFQAEVKGSYDPQPVNIIQMNDDGWAQISTYNGEWWTYLTENKRYLPRNTMVYDDKLGSPIFRIEPQVVTILEQDEEWIQISTYLGEKWVNLLSRSILPEDRVIAFTFDDGPSMHTERLLDELAERNVVATFFVLGTQVTRYPELTARIARDGHEIGSHSYGHPLFTRLTAARIRDEINRSHDAIYQATGVTPTLFRPPYGGQNATVRSVAAEFGLPLILWSVDTRDWETQNATAILSHFVNDNGVKVQNGDIVLMHDVYASTIDAAVKAIDLLLEEGFIFVTVSELLINRYGALAPGNVYRR